VDHHGLENSQSRERDGLFEDSKTVAPTTKAVIAENTTATSDIQSLRLVLHPSVTRRRGLPGGDTS
jgi:hypothetical protein